VKCGNRFQLLLRCASCGPVYFTYRLQYWSDSCCRFSC